MNTFLNKSHLNEMILIQKTLVIYVISFPLFLLILRNYFQMKWFQIFNKYI